VAIGALSTGQQFARVDWVIASRRWTNAEKPNCLRDDLVGFRNAASCHGSAPHRR
jgi:hypothetical protein